MPASSSPPPATFRQLSDVLARSLEHAFDEVCPERYGGPLELRQVDDSAHPQTISFVLDGPSEVSLPIDVTITHVGGNVYDLTAQVEDGDARRFTYSEPSASGSSLSIAPYLGKKIARHVLDEIEQRLGKKLLQNEMTPEAA